MTKLEEIECDFEMLESIVATTAQGAAMKSSLILKLRGEKTMELIQQRMRQRLRRTDEVTYWIRWLLLTAAGSFALGCAVGYLI